MSGVGSYWIIISQQFLFNEVKINTFELFECSLISAARYILFLALLWLIMVLFSYDFTASNLNQYNQEKQRSLASGVHHFGISVINKQHIVSSFQHHWIETDEGLLAAHADPEISIGLGGFKLLPLVHRTLKLSLLGSTGQSGQFSIELSNQATQTFYDSELLEVNQLSEAIELEKIKWRINQPNLQQSSDDKSENVVSWEDVGVIDALVIRFYGIQAELLKIADIEIKQSHVGKLQFVDSQCSQQIGMSCVITNAMNYDVHHAQQSTVFTVQSYPMVTGFHPLIWLLAAWLTAMFVMKLIGAQKVSVYALVCAVFVIILLTHQSWMHSFGSHLRWAFVAGFIGLLWQQREALRLPRKQALPVWLLTLLVALLLFVFEPEFEFIYSLPGYLLWALMQQMLIGSVFSQSLHQHTHGTRWQIACFIGVLFSVIHAPNHMLMLVTLVGGVLWSYAWLKYQNIYANAFSHALLALLLYQIMPEMWLGTARIGVFF